ncbi:hypothetical protein C8R43DRAFT_42726 [Mycena crocata]|nr:hypothetical protein C8R43DRAFT_42726 [Mycena crocata]
MPSLTAVRAFNLGWSSGTHLPVAIFVGGTSGIGRAIAEAFARYTKGNAHIILMGRNRPAAESILASFPKPAAAESGWRHEFVACDASLMRNIGATTGELLQRVPRINYLVITSGYASLMGRTETEEGIDHQLALRYYGRWKLINDLLPALREAKRLDQPSKVMSVLDTDSGSPVNSDDFGMKLKYSGMAAMTATLTYNDMALEEFAVRNPDIVFTHIGPGFVKTPLYDSGHWAMRLAAPLIKPMVWMFAKSPDVCAEHMLFGILSGEKGFIRRNEKGDTVGMNKHSASQELRKKLWDHTIQEVNVGAVAKG